jgi:spore germination protein YaaH
MQMDEDAYDGVNIDFEFLAASDAANLTLFLQELKAGIGADKILSIAVFARTASDQWPTAYDYQAIGAIADKVLVMAYDYHYASNPPGPVAPLWWVREVVAYSSSMIPSEKLLLGMPTYGYDWAEGMDGTTITAAKLSNLKSQYQVTESFDLNSMSPTYSYDDDQQISHQIWLENRVSLNEKYQVAIDNHLGGISFWRIGTGFQDLYDVLQDRLD